MKGKQLALVLVLLVALGGVAVFLRNRNSASWSEQRDHIQREDSVLPAQRCFASHDQRQAKQN